jgi:hypothetical protein
MKYYYLVASLPSLTLGAPLPMSPERLRTLCSEHLLPEHLVELEAVRQGGGRSDFARAWHRSEVVRRNVAARARAEKRGLDPERWLAPLPDVDLWRTRRALDALAAPDPKARERQLDELRIADLDERAARAPFALDAVLAYALKLDICARWAARTEAAGRARLTALVDAILEQFDRQENRT